jgi:ATP-dependent DNA helicase RecQ
MASPRAPSSSTASQTAACRNSSSKKIIHLERSRARSHLSPRRLHPVDVLHNAILKKRTPIDRDTLDRTIEKLLVAGVALMDMNGDVRLADDQHPGKAKWQSAYETQVAVRRAQIDRMIAFAESTDCRMHALVQHFGDTSDHATTCGLCDICNPGDSGSAQAAHQPTAQERAWLREILSALEHRSTSTGKLFTDLHLMKDRKDFDTLLDGLARAALITLTNDTFRSPEGKDITYRKAAITHEGRTPTTPRSTPSGSAPTSPHHFPGKRSRTKSASSFTASFLLSARFAGGCHALPQRKHSSPNSATGAPRSPAPPRPPPS